MALERKLYMYTFQGKWEEVERLYEGNPDVWTTGITSSEDTALHMAINEDQKDVVKRLVDIIVKESDGGEEDHRKKVKEALTKANEGGETPLHRAAARGSVKMCKLILDAATKEGVDLLRIRNEGKETPIFVAALHNRIPAFIYLFRYPNDHQGEGVHLVTSDELLTRPPHGDTVLHSTIGREHYELAFHILKLCPDLMGRGNEKGMTPLHILATKRSAFPSGSHLSWWQTIISCCIRVDPLEFEDDLRQNYLTCYQFRSSSGGNVQRDPENLCRVEGNVPQHCDTCFQFLVMPLRSLFGLLGFGQALDDIIKAKRKHIWSVQILDEMMKDPGKTYMTKPGSDPRTEGIENAFDGIKPGRLTDPFGVDYSVVSHDSPDTKLYTSKFQIPVERIKDLLELVKRIKDDDDGEARERTGTAFLVAAHNGVVEVVNKVLERLPVSIHDTSSRKKNIVMVAVEVRQPRILDALYTHIVKKLNKPQLWQDLLQGVDTDGNTVLHLAAKYGQFWPHHWETHGSAMQTMQWEIKWYERVKRYLPHHFLFLTNANDETPDQIFLRDHEKLVQSSSDWLKDTSDSSSVVAALVAGVSFAASTTVPGGNDDKTGKPTLEGHPGFNIFAIFTLIALCFSVIALIIFLSILTSRKKSNDFLKKLPVKLFLALSSLFVAIFSMFISFCAAHSFVLEDKFKKSVLPLYSIIFLSIFLPIFEFPLYMDLFRGIFTKV